MKKIFSVFMTIIMVLTMTIMGNISTFAAQSGDFSYFVTDYTTPPTSSVVKYTGKGGVVTIPDTLGGFSVTYIDWSAFEDSTAMTSVTIPNRVTEIGRYVFKGCTSLTSVALGSGVTRIGEEAFSGCTALTSVTIPSSVIDIDIKAFLGCTKLTQINVATNNGNLSSLDGVLFNKAQSTLLQFPRGKTGNYVVRNTVSVIGDFSFYMCQGLGSVVISDSVKSIGASAFRSSGVTSVLISDSTNSIGEFAFAYCTKLKSVTIGNYVNNIGRYAFNGCTGIVAASFVGNAPAMGSDVFARCASTFKVYYDKNKVGFTNPWKGYPTTSEVFVPATPTPTPAPTPTPTIKPTPSPTPKLIPVVSVRLNKTSLILSKGKTIKLTATVIPGNVVNKKVTWKSSNAKVASVSSTGTIKGINKGTVYISVYTVQGNKSARCKVTIK